MRKEEYDSIVPYEAFPTKESLEFWSARIFVVVVVSFNSNVMQMTGVLKGLMSSSTEDS